MPKTTKYLLNNHKTMDLFTTAISKVHVDAHPEVIQVRQAYVNLNDQAESENPNYQSSFETLREVTDSYTIPKDACEAMTTVYKKLQRADQLQNV